MNKRHIAKERENPEILWRRWQISAQPRIKTYFLGLIFAALKMNIIIPCWWQARVHILRHLHEQQGREGQCSASKSCKKYLTGEVSMTTKPILARCPHRLSWQLHRWCFFPAATFRLSSHEVILKSYEKFLLWKIHQGGNCNYSVRSFQMQAGNFS